MRSSPRRAAARDRRRWSARRRRSAPVLVHQISAHRLDDPSRRVGIPAPGDLSGHTPLPWRAPPARNPSGGRGLSERLCGAGEAERWQRRRPTRGVRTPIRRLPVGAEPTAGGAHVRVWAPRRRRVAVVARGRRRRLRSRPRPAATSPAPSPASAPAPATASASTAASRRSRPRLALAARGAARAVGGGRPGRFRWTRRGLARPRPPRARCSTSCTSAPSRPRAPGRAAARELPHLADARGHGARDDAGRRVPRPVRLGLRRRQPVRAHPALRHARRLPPLRRSRRTRSGIGVILDVVYNHLGPDGNYLTRLLAAYFTDRYSTEWGEAINFDGAGRRAGARVLRRERRLLDRRVPPRRPAARRHAEHLRRARREHILAELGRARAARPRRRAVAPGRARTSRRTRASCARRGRAATASTRCGTTTSTTAPSWR